MKMRENKRNFNKKGKNSWMPKHKRLMNRRKNLENNN